MQIIMLGLCEPATEQKLTSNANGILANWVGGNGRIFWACVVVCGLRTTGRHTQKRA